MRLVLALCALAFSTSSMALGPRYSQSFSSGAPGWAALDANHPWTAGSGYYANDTTPGGSASSVTLYNPASKWANNFAYSLRWYSSYPAAANRLGVIFGYASAGNYYEVLANTGGEVTVTRFVSGSATWSTTGAVAAFPADTWVPVQLNLLSGKLSVRINGVSTEFGAATSVTLPAVNNGQIGLVTRGNLGRFDDIDIVNLFFRTSFSGATLVPIPDPAPPDPQDPRGCNADMCWQEIAGQDGNFPDQQWPPQVWGGQSRTSKFQLLRMGTNPTPGTIGNYMWPEIQLVTGHTGGNTYALYQTIRQYSTAPAPNSTQMPYEMFPSTSSPQGPIYARMWVKLQSNLVQVQENSWRMFFQFKTDGDFRLSLYVDTYNTSNTDPNTGETEPTPANPPVLDHRPHWKVQTDNDGNGGLPFEVFTRRWQTTAPVPLGEWFKFEVFWDRGSAGSTNGRVWIAVNGETLFDYNSKLWGVNNAPINRIMLPTLYHGSSQAQTSTGKFTEQWIDDIEIWDGFPPSASAH